MSPVLGHLGVLVEPASVVAKAWEHIERIGLRVRACAVGQAAAAIFARAAPGRDAAEIEAAHGVLAAWLAEGGNPPDWPGLAALAEARGFPARHGAIMLPWTAARDALSSPPRGG